MNVSLHVCTRDVRMYTFTKLHDSVHTYGGSEEVQWYEMKNN